MFKPINIILNLSKHLIYILRQRSLLRTIEYALGRFYIIRSLRFFYLKYLNRSNSLKGKQNIYIKYLKTNDVMRAIDKKGLFEGIQLENETINKFEQLINNSKTIEHGTLKRELSIKDALNYNSSNPPNPILVIDHISKDLNFFSEEVARSFPLFDIAEQYLGKVKKIQTKVQTSLIANASNFYRESNGQTVTFHFDVEGFNFVYIFFYLTDCGVYSGAHESILGSHKRKKLSHLFSSARKTDKIIYKYYPGKDKVISGKAGFGFVEDTSCFHRALAPKNANRLCYQIRYVG